MQKLINLISILSSLSTGAHFIRASDKSAKIVKDGEYANLCEFLIFRLNFCFCDIFLCDLFILLPRDPTFLDYLTSNAEDIPLAIATHSKVFEHIDH